MKPQSAKNKGRTLQKYVISRLVDELEIHPEDVESRSMGAGGEDIIMSREARYKFPFSVECKNTERLSLWSAWKQAEANCGNYHPLIVIKKNRHKPLCVVDFETLLSIVKYGI